MTCFDKNYLLGFGTTRFPISSVNDIRGIEKSAELLVEAIEKGVDYIDTSYSYSYGRALNAINLALKNTKKTVSVTVKSMYGADKTADDTRKRIFFQLEELGLSKTDFFVCWNIISFEQFQKIMQKNGIYDGALKLKDENIISRICCSVHVPPNDIIKIIESKVFEGITISYNLLNASSMQPVLDCALKHNTGIAVMNPLAGGLIPQNSECFSYAKYDKDESVNEAALRFVKAHPAIKIVVPGINNETELNENLLAFTNKNPESDSERLKRTLKFSGNIKDYCTGCDYCAGCPKGIPVSEIMKSRNKLIFKSRETYNRTESELVKNINLFYRCDYLPETTENSCVKCGICEKKCTQKLNIIAGISDFYERAQNCGYSLNARKKRIREIFENKNYKRIGLFPNGGFADLVIDLYRQVFGETNIEWLFFNNNNTMQGQIVNGIKVCSPQDISELKPDAIIVCSYRYENEIYANLKKYEDENIKVVKLHRENEVPWVW